MKLSADIARCDGLLPKLTQIEGKKMVLWSLDCDKRETCARYCQMQRDMDNADGTHHGYYVASHKPGEKCPSYMLER